MNTRGLCLSGLLSMAIVAVAMAHDAPPPGKAEQRFKNVTMIGEIVDPQCYFTHDSRGAAHASCAAMCAKGGQGLAFLDDASGVVYPLIAKAHGASQNEGLLPHLGKTVQVKGMLIGKGSSTVLRIESVVASSAKAK